jgi:hypothetical protein
MVRALLFLEKAKRVHLLQARFLDTVAPLSRVLRRDQFLSPCFLLFAVLRESKSYADVTGERGPSVDPLDCWQRGADSRRAIGGPKYQLRTL